MTDVAGGRPEPGVDVSEEGKRELDAWMATRTRLQLAARDSRLAWPERPSWPCSPVIARSKSPLRNGDRHGRRRPRTHQLNALSIFHTPLRPQSRSCQSYAQHSLATPPRHPPPRSHWTPPPLHLKRAALRHCASTGPPTSASLPLSHARSRPCTVSSPCLRISTTTSKFRYQPLPFPAASSQACATYATTDQKGQILRCWTTGNG